jgi:hypothetical protein
MSSPAQPWGHAPGTGIQRVYVDSEYEQYSSMYEHEALATRTGILISADISPSMAAMTVNEIDQPPPMRAHWGERERERERERVHWERFS